MGRELTDPYPKTKEEITHLRQQMNSLLSENIRREARGSILEHGKLDTGVVCLVKSDDGQFTKSLFEKGATVPLWTSRVLGLEVETDWRVEAHRTKEGISQYLRFFPAGGFWGRLWHSQLVKPEDLNFLNTRMIEGIGGTDLETRVIGSNGYLLKGKREDCLEDVTENRQNISPVEEFDSYVFIFDDRYWGVEVKFAPFLYPHLGGSFQTPENLPPTYSSKGEYLAPDCAIVDPVLHKLVPRSILHNYKGSKNLNANEFLTDWQAQWT